MIERWTQDAAAALRPSPRARLSCASAQLAIERSAAAKAGDALARPRQQEDDERPADERVLSLRLEIVDARTQRAPEASSEARAAREVERPAPKPAARPNDLSLAWPDPPPSAAAGATLQGTPEAYRAVAAYDAQVQLQSHFRRLDDEAPHIRMRA